MNRLLASGVAVAAALVTTFGHAQSYDPGKDGSPRLLLQAPADPIAYHDAYLRAQALWEAKKYAEAEPFAEGLVRDYPRDPANWVLLGRVKRDLDKPAEALVAFRRAGPLQGWGLEFPNGYRVATAQLKAGDRKGALETLRWLIFDQRALWRDALYEWDDYAPLRNDPEFLKLIGRPDTKGWTRDEGWRRDLDFLREETKRVNPDYGHRPLPAEVERRYAALRRDIPTLSDAQVYFRMQLMLAPLNQGHVSFFPLPNGRRIKVRFYAFPEGVFIIDAEDRSLVGVRVLKVGELGAEEAWRRLAEARSADGDMERVWLVSDLADASLLLGMGAITSDKEVALTVEPRGGQGTRTVNLPTTAEPAPDDQATRVDRLMAPAGAPAPLFLSRMKDRFWHQALPAHDALYVQVNNLFGAEDETLEHYGLRLWDVINQTRPKNLVLDLRHNNGGTTQQYPELLRTLVAFSRMPDARLYVLIGRRSYSATGNFVTDLERLTDPLFVGEASSECCNLHGDPAVVTLPYSKLKAELTAVRWQLSTPGDRRRELSPEVPVQLTAAAFFAGRDPVMETVEKLIAKGDRLALPAPP